MRCWHPRAENVVKDVIDYDPKEVILMPLYPHYSQEHLDHLLKSGMIFVRKMVLK